MAVCFASSSVPDRFGRPTGDRRPKDGSLFIQEETSMSFDVGRPQGATVSHLTPRPRPATDAPETGEFAKVYDLAKVRRPLPEVPQSVWDEVERAAAIAADLEAAGRTIRFSEPTAEGRVKVELVDADGHLLRPISLGEAVSIGSTEPPSAA
jgi:hypothetical protein